MKDNHAPGPVDYCVNAGAEYGYVGSETTIICGIPNLNSHFQFVPEDNTRDSARLIAGAYSSYDRHCGDHAVECAEGDLLGECLTACKKVLRMYNSANPITGSGQWEKISEIPQILGGAIDKALGEV